MRCYELKIELFILQNPLESFKPNNRTSLRTISFGTIDNEEKEQYEAQQMIVEALFPFKWYNENQTYWEIKYSHIDEYKLLVDASDQYVRFMKSTQFDPLMLVKVNKSQEAKQKRKDDPDYGYLQYTNPKIHLNFNERHQLEKQDPLIYGLYSINTEFGCKHGLRGAYIYCDLCAQFFGCDICHNEEANHYILYKDVKNVKCCNCQLVQEISERCYECKTIFTNTFCSKCKTIQILDQQTEPFYHCEIHDQCHLFSMKEYAAQCTKCKQCVPITNRDVHECDEIFCLICQGIISTNFNFITLPCNYKHKMHEVCYQKYQEISCPLCRKCIMETSDKRRHQCRIIKNLLKPQAIRFLYHEVQLITVKCRDCLRIQINCELVVCRTCWLENIDEINEITVSKQELVKFLDGQESKIELTKETGEMRDDLMKTYKEVFEQIVEKLRKDETLNGEEQNNEEMEEFEEEEIQELFDELALEYFEEEESDDLF
ncbi:CHY_zinc finger domain-containing protein [Hexamita inflata]|uniref:CHY zinc finger domain-containing protein n=1 Tax=Hexamita inflata TaxID=28002 RepID=A0AA86PMT4_9EUKA|nr:CHY zinc finger domain-containing protein [Hexamita inflata]